MTAALNSLCERAVLNDVAVRLEEAGITPLAVTWTPYGSRIQVADSDWAKIRKMYAAYEESAEMRKISIGRAVRVSRSPVAGVEVLALLDMAGAE